MSEDQSEQNRSEDATPHKLQKARERGSVARGTDLAFLSGLSALLIYSWMMGDELVARVAHVVQLALATSSNALNAPNGLLEISGSLLLAAARPLLFVIGAIFFTVLLFEIVQLRGLTFSTQPLKPDFNRLNPSQGFKKIFSVRMLIETGKTVLKLVVYSAAAAFVVMQAWSAASITVTDAHQLSDGMGRLALKLMSFFLGGAIVFALFDQLVSRRDFAKRMRMSRREVKREHRDREGDSRLKQRRKELHKEFVKLSESLRGIRGADVLITNPTHYAVALRYDPDVMDAPRVVAKGAHQVAQRLRRMAFLYSMVIVESPALARALYRCDLHRPVPDGFFEPVAEVYRALRDRGALRRMSQANA
ncbi:MAG TPA: EscU/YscU/HrcU family type III secretion system export apparatus switch protein [Phenylobacterium sp.]